MKLKLTNKTNPNSYIKQTNPVFLRDTKTTGLAIKVLASGKHKYIAEFRADKRVKRITLGPFYLMSLSEARESALEAILNTIRPSSLTVRKAIGEYVNARTLSSPKL